MPIWYADIKSGMYYDQYNIVAIHNKKEKHIDINLREKQLIWREKRRVEKIQREKKQEKLKNELMKEL